MDLSKSDCKAARTIIEKGLLIEYANGLQEFDEIIQNWKATKSDNRDAYMALYDSVKKCDKHIARRYDNMKGSTYLRIIAAQMLDNVIDEQDLEQLSGEAQEFVLNLIKLHNDD